jgi:hypothetical protein
MNHKGLITTSSGQSEHDQRILLPGSKVSKGSSQMARVAKI